MDFVSIISHLKARIMFYLLCYFLQCLGWILSSNQIPKKTGGIWFGNQDDGIRCMVYNSKPFSLFLPSRNLHFNVCSLPKHLQSSQNSDNECLYVSCPSALAYMISLILSQPHEGLYVKGAHFGEVSGFVQSYTGNMCKAGDWNSGFAFQKSCSFHSLEPRDLS